ncbi:MAG TPA: SH3 domain-containing protein [Pyrinomonadaceae bacterium]
MSDKSGRSEEKEDFWGNKYTQHYDGDGNETGWSEQKEDFWGKKYTQTYDEDNKKAGWAEDKEDFWGNRYEQQYNEENDETGWSENKEAFWGNRYEQHYSEDNDKAGWSERKEGFWGNRYTQHYDGGAGGGSSTYDTAAGSSTSSSYGGSPGSSVTGGGYGGAGHAPHSATYHATPHPSGESYGDAFKSAGRALLLGILLYPVIGLGGCVIRIVAQGSPPDPMSQTRAHDVWLYSPLKSWTTEAVIIPLLIVAAAFFGGLLKNRQVTPAAKILLLLLGLCATLYLGSGWTNFMWRGAGMTSTVEASGQAGAVGTMREVNTVNLNMRSGPGTSHSVVATFPKKTRIVSYGETRTVEGVLWTQASTPDGRVRGWVNRKYLSP